MRSNARSRIAAAIRINAPLLRSSSTLCAAQSPGNDDRPITPEASAGDVKAGAGACATFAAVGGGEATTVTALGQSSVEATGVDSGILGADEALAH
jgi:hypothetical protein